jgi:hypothetical protein
MVPKWFVRTTIPVVLSSFKLFLTSSDQIFRES